MTNRNVLAKSFRVPKKNFYHTPVSHSGEVTVPPCAGGKERKNAAISDNLYVHVVYNALFPITNEYHSVQHH
jgi:hypothetical protein